MSFYIVQGDLLEQKADAIVIPSQPSLKLEGLIGERIKKICGDKLLMELEQLKKLPIGECAITNAYNLPCKRLIFCATPMWKGGKSDEEEFLRLCYENAILKAIDFGLGSIAFPLLSTGAYGYPKREAIRIAMEQIQQTAEDNDIDVELVIYLNETFKTYRDKLQEWPIITGRMTKDAKERLNYITRERGGFSWYTDDLPSVLNTNPKKRTFSQKLKQIIAEGKKPTDIYNGVISKAMYYKYYNGEVVPNKYTAVALGISLDMDEFRINDLLSSIGEELRDGIYKDEIILSVIRHHNEDFDCFKRMEIINKMLTAEKFPPLKLPKEK